jgi:hypothetical protein
MDAPGTSDTGPAFHDNPRKHWLRAAGERFTRTTQPPHKPLFRAFCASRFLNSWHPRIRVSCRHRTLVAQGLSTYGHEATHTPAFFPAGGSGGATQAPKRLPLAQSITPLRDGRCFRAALSGPAGRNKRFGLLVQNDVVSAFEKQAAEGMYLLLPVV